jgi:hypothetical protein
MPGNALTLITTRDKEVKKMGSISDGNESGKLRIGKSEKVLITF